MGRSGYNDDLDQWDLIRYRGAVKSAIRGRRGQTFLKEMLAAMDAMPAKRLVRNELETSDLIPCSHWGMFETTSVCAIGALGKARGVDMSELDPDDIETVAGKFGIADALAREVVYINDDWFYRDTPEQRFEKMRAWIVNEIRPEPQP